MDVWLYPGNVMCGSCGTPLTFQDLDQVPGAKAIGWCANEACDRRGTRLLIAPVKHDARVIAERPQLGATLP